MFLLAGISVPTALWPVEYFLMAQMPVHHNNHDMNVENQSQTVKQVFDSLLSAFQLVLVNSLFPRFQFLPPAPEHVVGESVGDVLPVPTDEVEWYTVFRLPPVYRCLASLDPFLLHQQF